MNKYIASRLNSVECIIKRAANKFAQLKKSRVEEVEINYTIDNLFAAVEMINQIRSRMNGSDEGTI